jgi:hypothetical protein
LRSLVIPLDYDDAPLSRQTPHLINQRGPLLDESTAQPMDRLDILVLYGLERYKVHVRP